MLSACDIDHDGKISYEEFCRFCTTTEKELWQLFQKIDKDRSGALDRNELQSAFELAGIAVSGPRLDRFFSYIDKDHNGTIDFSEWRGRHTTISYSTLPSLFWQRQTSPHRTHTDILMDRLPPLHSRPRAGPQSRPLLLPNNRQADFGG